MSQPARKLLHALHVQGAHRRANEVFVFPGERRMPFSGWSKAKPALDTASGVSGATGLQRLGVRLEVIGTVLSPRRIIALSRQPINGIIERPDIPGVPPKAEHFRSRHSSILHHLIECVRRHTNVSRCRLATDEGSEGARPGVTCQAPPALGPIGFRSCYAATSPIVAGFLVVFAAATSFPR
jgi:hypothetical protein